MALNKRLRPTFVIGNADDVVDLHVPGFLKQVTHVIFHKLIDHAEIILQHVLENAPIKHLTLYSEFTEQETFEAISKTNTLSGVELACSPSPEFFRKLPNRVFRQSNRVIHWNLGARKWTVEELKQVLYELAFNFGETCDLQLSVALELMVIEQNVANVLFDRFQMSDSTSRKYWKSFSKDLVHWFVGYSILSGEGLVYEWGNEIPVIVKGTEDVKLISLSPSGITKHPETFLTEYAKRDVVQNEFFVNSCLYDRVTLTNFTLPCQDADQIGAKSNHHPLPEWTANIYIHHLKTAVMCNMDNLPNLKTISLWSYIPNRSFLNLLTCIFHRAVKYPNPIVLVVDMPLIGYLIECQLISKLKGIVKLQLGNAYYDFETNKPSYMALTGDIDSVLPIAHNPNFVVSQKELFRVSDWYCEVFNSVCETLLSIDVSHVTGDDFMLEGICRGILMANLKFNPEAADEDKIHINAKDDDMMTKLRGFLGKFRRDWERVVEIVII